MLSCRQFLLTGVRTTRARSVAIALEPFLPGLVAPPCELFRYTLPTAEVHLVRCLPIKRCMWKDFIMFANVPANESSHRRQSVQRVEAQPLMSK